MNWKEESLETTRKIIDAGIIAILPERDQHGRKVVVINLAKRNTSVFSYADLLRTIFHCSNVLQDDTVTSLTGFVYIFNGSGISLQHIPSIKDLQFLSKTSELAIARIKTIILYKFPFFMSATVKFIRSIQSEKIRKRTQVAGNVEDIYAVVQPKSILPENFGGELTEENRKILNAELWSSEKAKSVVKFNRESYVDFDKVPKKGWFGF